LRATLFFPDANGRRVLLGETVARGRVPPARLTAGISTAVATADEVPAAARCFQSMAKTCPGSLSAHSAMAMAATKNKTNNVAIIAKNKPMTAFQGYNAQKK